MSLNPAPTGLLLKAVDLPSSPVGNIWQILRDNWLSNRIFPYHENITDLSRNATMKEVWHRRHSHVVLFQSVREGASSNVSSLSLPVEKGQQRIWAATRSDPQIDGTCSINLRDFGNRMGANLMPIFHRRTLSLLGWPESSSPKLRIGSSGRAALALLALVLLPGQPLNANPPVRERVISFGDSWTDVGTFGIIFGTRPGEAWPQMVAARLGSKQTPHLAFPAMSNIGPDTINNLSVKPVEGDGMNFAEGGSRVALYWTKPAPSASSYPIPMARQVDMYLAKYKTFPSDAVLTFLGGGNDIVAPTVGDGPKAYAFNTGHGLTAAMSAEADQMVVEAAVAQATLIKRALAAGARHIVVMDVIDLGLLPGNETSTPAGLREMSRLTALFNRTLFKSIPEDDRVLKLSLRSLFDKMIEDPAAYGYKSVLLDGCNNAAPVCGPENYIVKDAHDKYMFAGFFHFTARSQKYIADAVIDGIAVRWPGMIVKK